jgi:hypothetical protein
MMARQDDVYLQDARRGTPASATRRAQACAKQALIYKIRHRTAITQFCQIVRQTRQTQSACTVYSPHLHPSRAFSAQITFFAAQPSSTCLAAEKQRAARFFLSFTACRLVLAFNSHR